MNRNLITAALPYANGYSHLGHAAGAFMPSDMFARFKRLSGEETLYVCGSDEHGVAITIAAEKEGVTPQQIVDKYHTANEAAYKAFGLSFDVYSRTSLPEHHITAQEFFLDLLKKGFFTEKEEEQFYDSEANMFLPDRYVEGTCPNCGNEGARGDQCDKCGAYYNQMDLKNPKSLVSGKTPEVRKTTHWYFKMGDFQKQLEDYISSKESTWKDNVLQQTRSWLKAGLGDRAITRDLNWGIPVPLESAEGKVLYVWFEAVLGYISATKVWAKEHGRPDEWKKWWQDGATDYYSFIGKDNIVFHTIIFPAILMAKGDYILPKNVPGNEFLNLEGQKFSKSRNWAIDLQDFLKDFPEPQHVDALRYTLATTMPETKDSDFTWKDLGARNNNELAAIFGNFVNRTLQFLLKNFGGKVPTLPERFSKLPEAWKLLLEDFARENSREEATAKLAEKHLRYFSPNDFNLLSAVYFGTKTVAEKYNEFKFRDAVAETMNVARAANKYFNDTEPWKTVKNNPDECAKTMFICTQVLRSLSVLFAPVVPNACSRLSEMLGEKHYAGEVLKAGELLKNTWETAPEPGLEQGRDLAEPQILFLKIEDEQIQTQLLKLGNGEAAEPKVLKEEKKVDSNTITIDDFKKVQLRTGVVLEAEKLPKSEKLLKLIVDIGTEKRQILAGIAKFYTPEEMVGKTVVVVVNLAPAKLMGHESQGMLLAANTAEGNLALVTPEKDTVSSGAEVR
ncbi:MAG: methionine--tRNA ligase [Bacteroidota bacterium]